MKKIIFSIVAIAFIFIGCGGGGGSASTSPDNSSENKVTTMSLSDGTQIESIPSVPDK